MAINRETSERIKNLLKEHPEGRSITDIVAIIPVNRNTASRYLDTLLVSGQVEMRHFGMAKIYSLTRRLPVSSVLSISSEYAMQIDYNLRIVFINAPFLEITRLAERDVLGRKIDQTRLPELFGDEYPRLLRWISDGLAGIDRQGEIHLAVPGRVLACRVTPAVFSEGQKGVSILFDDITSQRRDEELLRESEEKFRTFIEAATGGIMLCDTDGHVIVWNEAMSRITGIPMEKAKGAFIPDLILGSIAGGDHDEGRTSAIRTRLRNAIRTGSSPLFYHPTEAEIVGADGERRAIQHTLFPIRTSRGTLIGTIVYDITERRRMLAEISEREERFKALFNNAADMITVHGFTPEGLPGTFIEVNDIACRRLGYTREELLRLSPRDLLDPSCMDAMRENAAVLQANGSAVFEMIHVTKDHRKIPVEIRSHIFEFQNKRLVLAQVRDISQRKEAEAAIRESETRLSLALSGSDTGMWELDVSAMTGRLDARAAGILGYEGDEMVTPMTEWDRFSHPDDYPLLQQRLKECLEGRTPGFEAEHRVRHRSGEWIWIAGKGRITQRLPDGSPLRITGTLQDITARKRAEEELRTTSELYRTIAESATDMIYITACDGSILYANSLCARMYNCTPKSLVGKRQEDLFPPGVARKHLARIREVVTTKAPVGHIEEVPTPSGTIAIDIRLSPILSEEGRVISIIGIARNVTGRNDPGAADRKR